MIYYLDMIRINVHEAKAHLSRYLDQILAGETVVVCRRNVPIAELRALPQPLRSPRTLGQGRGLAHLPDAFFDPLPDELLDAFEGRSP